jgi:APA family basic amino acid/polyamine antiporter
VVKKVTGADQAPHNGSHKLVRALTLKDAVVINLGAIIGAGIFVIMGLATGISGPAVVLSIILAAFIALLTGLSFSEIARHVAKEGGVYEYSKETLSPFSGFLGGLLWTFGNIIALSAVSLSLGSYIDALFHATISNVFFAIPAILAFMIINILGIKNSAKTLLGLVAINIFVLLLFVVVGMLYFHAQNFNGFFQKGAGGLIEGTALIFFAFTGFSRVTTVSEEIIKPEKTIPYAIMVSIAISAVLYVLVAISALGLVPSSLLAKSASPLSFAVSVLHNPIIDTIIALGGITATAGVLLTGVLGTSRVFFAMSRDNELPRKLDYVDKFSTPIYSILLSSFLGIVFLTFISFIDIVEIANVSILLAYSIVNISALNLNLKLRKRSGAKHLSESRYFTPIPILGAAVTLLIAFSMGIKPVLYVLPVIALGILYYSYKTSKALRNVERYISKEIPIRSIVREFGGSRANTSGQDVRE